MVPVYNNSIDCSTWHVCRPHHRTTSCPLTWVCRSTAKAKRAGGRCIQPANRDPRVKKSASEMI